MKATIDIPDALLDEAKARAASEGMKLEEFVTSALKAHLSQTPVIETKCPPCPFPIVHGKGGPLLAGLNNEIIAKLEEEDLSERSRRPLGR